MSINPTSPDKGCNFDDLETVSNRKLADVEKNQLKTQHLKEIQTNIGKEIGTNFFTRILNYVFHHERTVTLRKIQGKLSKGERPEVTWLTTSLPPKIEELFRSYIFLLEELKIQEDFKASLTQEEFLQIWNTKQSNPIGKGGFGIVYQSAGGKYALKVANPGRSIADDTVKNKALKHNAEAFDPKQKYYSYYTDNDGFITKYVGTFRTNESKDVVVFEKIEGNDFSKCDAISPADQCHLLAQAATAIAISHEAGCINSDIKPANMMVSEKPLVLKLIDQGGIIDLTKLGNSATTCTFAYAAPEVEGKISPAFDVFSLGVTILEKLGIYNPTLKGLGDCILDGFYDEVIKGTKGDYSRQNVSRDIAPLFERNKLFGTPEESKFVGLLLRDCLAYKPEDRISAAQAAEILQVFSTYLENPSEGCPDYEAVKAMAVQDCPKGIPIALRKMLFNSDKKIQQSAISAIKNLVEADPSYKNTPSYGMFLLLKGLTSLVSNESFEFWAGENPEALQQLKDRTYFYDQKPSDEQDMPVSEEIYRRIQNFPIKSA